MKKELLLLDGDELVYKAGFASQTVRYSFVNKEGETILESNNKAQLIEELGNNDEELELIKEIVPKDKDIAEKAIYAVLNTALHDTRPDDYRIYLTGEGNFREEVATLVPYKGNRGSGSRPYYYDFIREILIEVFKAKEVNGMEADDALSITQWHHFKNNTKWTTILGSQDKDLNMVPGTHYNPSTRKEYSISPIDGRFFFYVQMMTGDSTDNIPGIYRTGPVSAEKHLLPYKEKSDKELFDKVIQAYEKARLSPSIWEKMPGEKEGAERVIEIARLIWMLQEKDQVWEPGVDYYGLS